MDIATLINQFGLPLGLAAYFIWRDSQSQKQHMEDLRNIATKSVEAIQASTTAIESNSRKLEELGRMGMQRSGGA